MYRDPIVDSPLPKRRRIENDDDEYGDDAFVDEDLAQLDGSHFTSPPPQAYQTQPTQIIQRGTPQPKMSQILVPGTSPSSALSPTTQVRSSPPALSQQRRAAPLMAPPGTAFRPPPSLNQTSQGAPTKIYDISDSDSDSVPKESDSEDETAHLQRTNIQPSILRPIPKPQPPPNAEVLDRFKQTTSKWAYNPASTVPQKRDSGDMLSAYGNSSRARGDTRPVKQVGPARALPVRPLITGLSDIAEYEHKMKVQAIRNIFTTTSYQDIFDALVQKKWHHDDAINYLVEKEDAKSSKTESQAIDLTSEDELALTPDKKGLSSYAGTKITTKRNVTGPSKNIMSKYSHLTQKPSQGQSSKPGAISLLSSQEARKPLRRLKKGLKSRSRTPEKVAIEITSESEVEVVEEVYNHSNLNDRLLKWFNECSEKELLEFASNFTTQDAQLILSNRPYRRLDQIRKLAHEEVKLTKNGKRRAPQRAIGDRMVEACEDIFEGLDVVDKLVATCEKYSKDISAAIEKWGISTKTKDGALDLTSMQGDHSPTHDSGVGTPASSVDMPSSKSEKKSKHFLGQPAIMSTALTMKDYQIVGLNWLNLLWSKRLSCILADDMGLGKTCQVISFLSHLYEQGVKGPHLVIVPASTLENWLREFSRFSPSLVVEPYHGPKAERPYYATNFLEKRDEVNVIVTTYDMAQVTEDNKFMRQLRPTVTVFDEGHTLKNPNTKRYQNCMRIPTEFRLMLTGTPLQNNLQELVSVLSFLQPTLFDEEAKEKLNFIFKHKAKTADEDHEKLLSAQRTERAKVMITPFILRRKKAVVLRDLPKKTCRVEYCDLTENQKEISDHFTAAHQAHLAKRAAGEVTDRTTNYLIRRRQAAIHPLLFRWHYFDDLAIIKKMGELVPKKKPFNNYSVIKLQEEFEWEYNDFQLHKICENNSSIPALRKKILKKDAWMDSGKVTKLAELLQKYIANGDRTLLFSQFTTVLDILESVLSTLSISFCRIDGSTPIERRQELLDTFHNDTTISVFMLSTRSGGTGINLACANKVIIFDQSFNPQDDVQAENRAHRVGQTREVEVVRLVTRGTVEEQILALGRTKLALDERVAGGDGTGKSGAKEKEKEDSAYREGEELVERMLLEGEKSVVLDEGNGVAIDAGEDKSDKGRVVPPAAGRDLKDLFVNGMKEKGHVIEIDD